MAERDQAGPEEVKSARAAIDPGRLLPGEDPDGYLLEDAIHWVAVYSELLAGKTRVLDATIKELEAATHAETQSELTHDQTLLLAELERFQRRLRFWHDREVELRGAS